MEARTKFILTQHSLSARQTRKLEVKYPSSCRDDSNCNDYTSEAAVAFKHTTITSAAPATAIYSYGFCTTNTLTAWSLIFARLGAYTKRNVAVAPSKSPFELGNHIEFPTLRAESINYFMW